MAGHDFVQIAQQLVDATSPLVSGRTVNIMDTDGVIIASSDDKRIGTLHEGALVAVRTGETVFIEKDQLHLYPGAKEGCNMPISCQGKIIGVVGIYGNPEEVADTARLLAVYTMQYLEQNAHLQEQIIEKELRNKLLDLLLTLGCVQKDNVVALMKALHIKLLFPARVLMIGICDEIDSIGSLHIYHPILIQLREQGLLDPLHDIWGMHDDRITIIKSNLNGQDNRTFRQIKDVLNNWQQISFRLTAGSVCQNLADLCESAREAATLFELEGGDLLDIIDSNCFVQYLLYRTQQRYSDNFEALCQTLSQNFSEQNLATMLETAQYYYDASGSVSQAAKQLHIHKNTLQYRVRRISEALGIESMRPFEREYLIRLCILHYHNQKS